MMTPGQFLGVLFAMFLGILLMTNEFAHQTALATFMTVPRRTAVIMAKLAAAACFGALFWLAATVINGVTTPLYLHSQHVSTALTGWIVVHSVLLNLLAFVIWGVFGLGLGTLIRSRSPPPSSAWPSTWAASPPWSSSPTESTISTPRAGCSASRSSRPRSPPLS